MTVKEEKFRIIRRWFRGRGRRYWVQIHLIGSLGLGSFWYDVNEVTPYGSEVNGFKTKDEARSFMETVDKIFNP